MTKLYCFLLVLNCWLDCFVCNKTDTLIVTSMKNDLTKSVKKVLDSNSSIGEISQNSSSRYSIDSKSDINNTNNNSIGLNLTKPVPFEGGGFIHVPSVHSATNVSLGSKVNHSSLSDSTSVEQTSQKIYPVPSEGGGTVHLNITGNITSNTDIKPENSSTTTTTTIKKVTEERKISARKGVVFEPLENNITISTTKLPTPKPKINVSTSTTVPTQPTTRMHKPKYAMIIGDHESKERKSFIESPTTGKDYIFPIVLIIMALPLLFLIIKLIYKRGSEYTERRHYDRMYLIDGMYNTR